jgi:hypothetical protein
MSLNLREDIVTTGVCSALHLFLCSRCRTEFTYQPDSSWVTIVLPGMKSRIE